MIDGSRRRLHQKLLEDFQKKHILADAAILCLVSQFLKRKEAELGGKGHG
jgi:hypothetical protein